MINVVRPLWVNSPGQQPEIQNLLSTNITTIQKCMVSQSQHLHNQNNVTVFQASKGKRYQQLNAIKYIHCKSWRTATKSQSYCCWPTLFYCNNGILNIVNTCQQSMLHYIRQLFWVLNVNVLHVNSVHNWFKIFWKFILNSIFLDFHHQNSLAGHSSLV